jgi:hypothetical protein
MNKQPRLRDFTVKLSLSEHYIVCRMLMIRERLTREQWVAYERSAETICNQVLRQLLVDYADSEIWDNRRRRS